MNIHRLSSCHFYDKRLIERNDYGSIFAVPDKKNKIMMDKLKKFDLMEKIANELEDLKNSQTAIVQKIGKIEIDNFDLANKTLERILPEMHQNVADNLDKIAEILISFEEAKDAYGKKNNIDELREQESIREAMEGGEK